MRPQVAGGLLVELSPPGDTTQAVRREVDGPPAVDALEHDPAGHRRFGKAKIPVGRDGRKELPLVLPGHQPVGDQPHRHPSVHVLEAEAREGNAHLGGPAGVVPAGRHVPEGVPVVVGIAGAVVGNGAIDPGPGRVDGEPRRGLAIVVGIQHQGDEVVAGVAVAIERVRADLPGLVVEQPRAEVDVAVVVGDPDLALLGERAAEGGRVHDERQRGHLVPGRLAQAAIQLDGPGEPGKPQGLLTGLGSREPGQSAAQEGQPPEMSEGHGPQDSLPRNPPGRAGVL